LTHLEAAVDGRHQEIARGLLFDYAGIPQKLAHLDGGARDFVSNAVRTARNVGRLPELIRSILENAPDQASKRELEQLLGVITER
jgi:hypothetical protein